MVRSGELLAGAPRGNDEDLALAEVSQSACNLKGGSGKNSD